MIHCDGERVIVEGSGLDILRDFGLIAKAIIAQADEEDAMHMKDILHRTVNGEFGN